MICSICSDTADGPVFTSCGHVFCYECLMDWYVIKKYDRKDFDCPLCRRVLHGYRYFMGNGVTCTHCRKQARGPVITRCGHLLCRSCHDSITYPNCKACGMVMNKDDSTIVYSPLMEAEAEEANDLTGKVGLFFRGLVRWLR